MTISNWTNDCSKRLSDLFYLKFHLMVLGKFFFSFCSIHWLILYLLKLNMDQTIYYPNNLITINLLKISCSSITVKPLLSCSLDYFSFLVPSDLATPLHICYTESFGIYWQSNPSMLLCCHLHIMNHIVLIRLRLFICTASIKYREHCVQGKTRYWWLHYLSFQQWPPHPKRLHSSSDVK